MTAISVAGGVYGIAANLDDLEAMGGLVHAARQVVVEAEYAVGAPWLKWAAQASAPASACGADEIAGLLADLTPPFGRLAGLDELLGATWFALCFAADEYRAAERAVQGRVGTLADALGGIGGILSSRGILPRGLIAPEAELPFVLAPFLADGHPVVHDLGPDRRPQASVPPRSLADLARGLATRNQGRPGEISVSFVTGRDGVRRAIVDLPGTKSWLPLPVSDVTSVGTDVIAMTGRSTSYEEGVFDAMHRAGVTSTTPVLLVGHSEGGIVAVDAARHAARSGRFAITHVVTAGSPVGGLARGLPSHVQLLALENDADLVPTLDESVNPDRRNVVTVHTTMHRGGVTADHDMQEVYVKEAVAADAARNPSVDAFRDSAGGFLDSDTITTRAYVISRGD